MASASSPARVSPLLLASKSPRRRLLLEAACFDLQIVVPTLKEEHLDGELDQALRDLAFAKLESAVTTNEFLAIAADTIVVIDGELLGKPTDNAHATAMLEQLSGREHQVKTGFAVMGPKGQRSMVVTTQVRFRNLNTAEIARYVASGDPLDKAGSYGIQNSDGGSFVDSLDGSYTNVVGLPMREVLQALKELA